MFSKQNFKHKYKKKSSKLTSCVNSVSYQYNCKVLWLGKVWVHSLWVYKLFYLAVGYTDLYWNTRSELLIAKNDKYISYSKRIQKHKNYQQSVKSSPERIVLWIIALNL